MKYKRRVGLFLLVLCVMVSVLEPKVSYAASTDNTITKIYVYFGTGKCNYNGKLVDSYDFKNVKLGKKITLPSVSNVRPADDTYRFTGFMLKRLADQKWYTKNKTWSKTGTKKLFKPGSKVTYKKSWRKGLSEITFFRFYAQYERVHVVCFRERNGTLYKKLQVAKNEKFELLPLILLSNQRGWYASRVQGKTRYWYCTNKKWCSDSEIRTYGYKKKLYEGGAKYKLDNSWLKGYSGYAHFDFYPTE